MPAEKVTQVIGFPSELLLKRCIPVAQRTAACTESRRLFPPLTVWWSFFPAPQARQYRTYPARDNVPKFSATAAAGYTYVPYNFKYWSSSSVARANVTKIIENVG